MKQLCYVVGILVMQVPVCMAEADVQLFDPFQSQVSYTAIAVDSAGHMWLGTDEDGAYRYDGTEWTRHDTSDGVCANAISALAVDTAGTVWFGTEENGVCAYNGTGYETYDTSHGLAGNDVQAIGADVHGSVWFGCKDRGISRFDGTTWTTFDTTHGVPGTDFYAIAAGPGDSVWVGTNGSGAGLFDGSGWTGVTTEDGLLSDRVLSLYIEQDGSIHMGTTEGLYSFDGQRWDSLTMQNSGMPCNSVIAVQRDSYGTLWLGIAGCGVSSWDGTRWQTYNTTDGLLDNWTTLLEIDRQDNIWFVTSQYEVITMLTPERSAVVRDRAAFGSPDAGPAVLHVKDNTCTVRRPAADNGPWGLTVYSPDGRCLYTVVKSTSARQVTFTLPLHGAGVYPYRYVTGAGRMYTGVLGIAE
jgi:hypothetical protein